jgi:hypothetical protein
MANNPLAGQVFDFVKIYISQRDFAAPGSGTWSNPVTIFDGTISTTFAKGETFTAGGLVEGDSHNIVTQAFGGSLTGLAYLGDGLPSAPQQILYAGKSESIGPSWWNSDQGCYLVGGVLYLVVLNFVVTVIASSDSGATWTQQDPTNGPTGLNQDGTFCATQRVDDKIVVFTTTDQTDLHFAIWEFDMTTGLWSAPITTLTISNFFDMANQPFTNGVFKFANGDYLVFYDIFSGASQPFCRLWTPGGGWGSPHALPGAQCANFLMDPDLDTIHICTYDASSGQSPFNFSQVEYSRYRHTTDTVTPSITTIPAAVGMNSDGVGHMSIQGGMIFIPRDDYADLDNSVWVGTLPVTALVKELLPVPSGEGGKSPSCAYMMYPNGYSLTPAPSPVPPLINPGPAGRKPIVLPPNKFDYCLHREYRLFCNIDYAAKGCARPPKCFTVDEREWGEQG